MNPSSGMLLELFQVMCLLQGFRFSKKGEPNIMFVPGRAQHDEAELLYNAGLWFGKIKSRRYLVFPGHDGSYSEGKRVPTGYAGFERWKSWISEYGLSSKRVVPCIVRFGHEQITHTREETDGFVLRAKEHDWKRALVLAHPHQLPRVMGCLLKSMEVLGYQLEIFPLAPTSTEWHTVIFGSLGQQQKPRWRHIEEELNRIIQYTEKGWMASLGEIREYLLSAHGVD